MAYSQNNRRRGRNWVSYLFPLVFLLIFVFTRSLAGLLVSLAIIVLLWVFISAAPVRSGMQNTPPIPMQPPAEPLYTPPEPQMPYEQGYMGSWSSPQPAQPFPNQAPLQGSASSEESERLAKLKLLGDLYHSGRLTREEFESQKQRVLQSDTDAVTSETQSEEQPQAQYPEELPPMQH
jgi:hypothetical protein